MTLCLIGFAGFLRFKELVNIRRSDVVFHDNRFEIFLERSKTDVYRDGHWVIIAKTNSKLCPYHILKRYLEKANISNSFSDEFIFRALSFHKKDNVYRLRPDVNKHTTYSRTREVVLEALESVGLNKKKFGLHSLRAGGASAAANRSINDRLFKNHGRWKSENAKDGYVKDDLKFKLSVTLGLGL